MRLQGLKVVREASGKTQKEVSSELLIPIDTYRGWEQLKANPRSDELLVLADYFKCSTDALYGRTNTDLPPGAVRPAVDETVMVRLYGSIAAGEAIEMIEEYDWFPVPKKLVERHPDAFLLTVKGASMNFVLPDGSYALVDPQQIDVIDKQIYAITVNGFDATVKRLVRLNNGMRLIPDSTDPTYKEQILDFNDPETEQLRIIGRVIWYTVSFDHLTGEDFD